MEYRMGTFDLPIQMVARCLDLTRVALITPTDPVLTEICHTLLNLSILLSRIDEVVRLWLQFPKAPRRRVARKVEAV